MATKPATPGTLLLGQILVADEPDHAGVTVFTDDGTVLLTVTLRRGADISQIMLGLSANQALQLVDQLSVHAGAFRQAVAEGRGGARFVDTPDD